MSTELISIFVLKKKIAPTSEIFNFVCLQKLLDVQDFLKVPQRDLKSRQVKIHKGTLSNQIENWGDVEKTLTGTQYENFLHADYQRR